MTEDEIDAIAETLIPLVESRINAAYQHLQQLMANLEDAVVQELGVLQQQVNGMRALLGTDQYKKFVVGEAARLGVTAQEIVHEKKRVDR